MYEYSSRILRIGLVNSGMFDLLELNFDVEAIHFIGENNVGKTSLIELIQFLYFHNVQEITFSKSQPESMAFYFRPEGSYILFQVRTLVGTIRTVGIYGEGTSKTRKIFVFDGPFALQEFLDDSSCVLPLQQVQDRFFERNFCRYQKFEQYERALLGQDKESTHNVQLFQLSSVTNFRLLRRLLQNLLRLDKLTSKDAQEFIVKIVESKGVQTTINIVQEFERKNRSIQHIQNRLNHLKELRPLILAWQKLSQEVEQFTAQQTQQTERLFHISARYLGVLENQEQDTRQEYDILQEQIEQKERTHIEIVGEQSACEQRLAALGEIIAQYEELQRFCKQHLKIHAEQERQALMYRKAELEKILADARPENAGNLRRQLTIRRKEAQQIQRRIESRTLQNLLEEAKFPEDHRALLYFLISQKVLALPVAGTVVQNDVLLENARQLMEYVGQDGTFRGFGLHIPKSEWYTPEDEVESLEEQLERAQKDIINFQNRLEAAEEGEKKQRELQRLARNIEKQEEIIRKFERLQEFADEHGDLESFRDRYNTLQTENQILQENQQQLQAEIKALRRQEQVLFVRVSDLEKQVQRIRKAHSSMRAFDAVCPEDILLLAETELDEAYRSLQKTIAEFETKLQLIRADLHENQAELESYHDRESPETDFEEWMTTRLAISEEIVRVEEQLRANYDDLIKQVGKELSNLNHAFELVQLRVNDLNRLIGKVNISNIKSMTVELQESDLVKAIHQINQIQEDLFSPVKRQNFSLEDAQKFVDEFLLGTLQRYRRDVNLSDMFELDFLIEFGHSTKPLRIREIHNFESNGTRTLIKIVLYLGLIKLLEERKKHLGSRIPFFLDEVGSIDSNNLRQLIKYCTENDFLPIFASPDIRHDIRYNFVFRRNGKRSVLENEIIITEKEVQLSDEAA